MRLGVPPSAVRCDGPRPFDPPKREVRLTEVQLDIDSLKREGTEVARYRMSAGERIVIGRRGSRRRRDLDMPGEGRAPPIT